MKKSTLLFILFLSLFLNIFCFEPAYAHMVLKEGIYKFSDLSLPSKNEYEFQNISPTDTAVVGIIDGTQEILTSNELTPNSPKFKLPPMKPDYKIVIIGKGLIKIE
ncbi:hypothetical protein [Clostridium sp. 'White wine YQ']|uniref:hypothetical protein n=1 Tax=Clostridium sp. 'White wine YQ' TaxID=3027474 RepID=UPI002366A845|nr:hypothetical protein [Clostridium sp. 'White wine YQ']MDD7793721.1 hypothetical protein [Clostridium sp. 'White wine YQ']